MFVPRLLASVFCLSISFESAQAETLQFSVIDADGTHQKDAVVAIMMNDAGCLPEAEASLPPIAHKAGKQTPYVVALPASTKVPSSLSESRRYINVPLYSVTQEASITATPTPGAIQDGHMDWVQILTAERSSKPAGYIVKFNTPFLATTKSDGQVRIHIHEDFEQHLSELADTTVRVWSPRTPHRYAEYDFQDVVLTTDAVTHGFLVEIPATKTTQTNDQ